MMKRILILAALLAGCDNLKSETVNSVVDIYVSTDQGTGCQYLAKGDAMTPRIAADGKTHLGCRAGRP